MGLLVANCPRCGASKITFDVTQQNLRIIGTGSRSRLEVFCVCRSCKKSTIFNVTSNVNSDFSVAARQGGANFLGSISGDIEKFVSINDYVGIKDLSRIVPPDYLPADILAVFEEGASCLSVECWNAAATMFRMCVDLATRPMLPAENDNSINSKQRRDLGLRLPWLFENGKLTPDLRDLSSAIKEDGNDGAHQGTLSKADAEDVMDFTFELLERLFTEPERLRLAAERRVQRRSN